MINFFEGFDEVEEAVEESVDVLFRPYDDVLDVVDGLSELELRESAALRLGESVVWGMSLSELVEWYNVST